MRRRLAVGFSLSLFSRGCGLHTAALRKKGTGREGRKSGRGGRARDKVRKGTKMETVLVTQSNFARVPSSVEIHLPPPWLMRSSKERKGKNRREKKGIHPCRLPSAGFLLSRLKDYYFGKRKTRGTYTLNKPRSLFRLFYWTNGSLHFWRGMYDR